MKNRVFSMSFTTFAENLPTQCHLAPSSRYCKGSASYHRFGYFRRSSTVERGVAGAKLRGPGLKGGRENVASTWSNLKVALWNTNVL